MTPTKLTIVLAETVMGWRCAPNRFLLGDRQWISWAQFQPLHRVQDAFRLLQRVASTLSLTRTVEGVFTATVRIGEQTGSACGDSEAATITLALARALRLEVGE
jgi:hypothetical protein